jgi:hypothetical protein
MLFRARRDAAAEALETVARVRGALQGYAATAPGQDVHVSVAHVLNLLDPRGLWSHDPERRKAARDDPELTGDRDPVTGCRPAVAPVQRP